MEEKAKVFGRDWIITNALEEIPNYDKGILTIRGLHYRLVSRGMTNDMSHYKKVVSAMIKARWMGLVAFDTFSDHDRAMLGITEIAETTVDDAVEGTKDTIKYWLKNYYKNKWENQEYYPEVFIEKKALIGVFRGICDQWGVALGACKGYPSLTFLNQARGRFKEAYYAGKKPVILYFGDYDPSGEDIPRSIGDNLSRLGVEVEIKRIALMDEQVIEWNLPFAPAKRGDSRTKNWDGLGQVELDAVEPNIIENLCADAIAGVFNHALHTELLEQQAEEKEEYQSILKDWMKNIEDELD